MYLQGFGDVIADIMTVNPAIADIPSASAILDASNYTFNAVTLGKDAEGFRYHAHSISSTAVGPIYNGDLLLIQGYDVDHPSSYVLSSTQIELSATYSALPQAPTIYDTRLESAPTTTNVASGEPDLGHYINAAIHPDFSSVWNVMGGFAPEGNTKEYQLLDSDKNLVVSGTLSGVYNLHGVVDKNGFITISETSGITVPTTALLAEGALVVSSTSYTPGLMSIGIVPMLGDAVTLAAFGGVQHVGVWCLDLKAMLADGLMPPYSWDHLNNNRQYKLVAKATTVGNVLQNRDFVVVPGVVEAGGIPVLGLGTGLTLIGPSINLYFYFT